MKSKHVEVPLFWASLVGFVVLLYDIGFHQKAHHENFIRWFYLLYAVGMLAGLSVRIFFKQKERPLRRLAHYITWGLALSILLAEIIFGLSGVSLLDMLGHFYLERWLAGMMFVTEFSERLFAIQKQPLHPALIFAVSFLFLIFGGTFLLMVPSATYNGINFVDALFTSTSAVCVTGLAILDTGKDFTRFGQISILILIQMGGLGVLTFTNLFGLFFRGKTSFQNQIMLKDFINAENIGQTFRTLVKIVLFTLAVESIGAVLIYSYMNEKIVYGFGEQIFFSVFHAVSAFCNAGFSTLTNGLYEESIRFNYGIHLVVAVLIIIGGIGYIVVFNYFTFIKTWILNKYQRLFTQKHIHPTRPLISLNTKIVVYTTFLLLVVGMLAFYILEYNNTLKEHHGWGKVVEAFFGSVTPRTAGFNTVNIKALTLPTLLIYLLLMWIGASPGSTGGGIKTSTFAIVTLNIWQQLTGKRRMELGWKEIPQKTQQRAFSIMSLSLVALGFSVFLVSIFDGELGLMPLAFECFSAYGTVGLSMGITHKLSDAGKIVLTITMFIGRVSFLTLLVGIVQQFFRAKNKPYQFPEEDIFIS
jgi:trk system potassium uptake protein TrkH